MTAEQIKRTIEVTEGFLRFLVERTDTQVDDKLLQLAGAVADSPAVLEALADLLEGADGA